MYVSKLKYAVEMTNGLSLKQLSRKNVQDGCDDISSIFNGRDQKVLVLLDNFSPT